MKTIHLAVGTVSTAIHVEAILRAVMMIQRSRACSTHTGPATGRLKAIRVETSALNTAGKPVDTITAVLLRNIINIMM